MIIHVTVCQWWVSYRFGFRCSVFGRQRGEKYESMRSRVRSDENCWFRRSSAVSKGKYGFLATFALATAG